jgi:hypothetical protein
MKQITIKTILGSDANIQRAIDIYQSSCDGLDLHAKLRNLVQPEMARINAETQQQNDVDYMALAVQYALQQASK